MEILNLQREYGAIVARFDLQLGPHLRLYSLSLRRARGGGMSVFAPNAHGKHAASFHPDLAKAITSAACAALREPKALDRNAAA